MCLSALRTLIDERCSRCVHDTEVKAYLMAEGGRIRLRVNAGLINDAFGSVIWWGWSSVCQTLSASIGKPGWWRINTAVLLPVKDTAWNKSDNERGREGYMDDCALINLKIGESWVVCRTVDREEDPDSLFLLIRPLYTSTTFGCLLYITTCVGASLQQPVVVGYIMHF